MRPNLQIWTCSLFWGLNSDDFPFFKTISSLSRSRVMPNLGLLKNREIFGALQHDEDDDDCFNKVLNFEANFNWAYLGF